jgi:protein-tyrosine-phosphatase
MDLGAISRRCSPRTWCARQILILAMGRTLDRIEALGGAGRAYLLSDYASRGSSSRAINDPAGAALDVYRSTADELEQEIRRVLDRIAAERGSGAA